MLFRRIKVLREQEGETGSGGAGEEGASGATDAAAPKEKSIHDRARELPWVQDALNAKAERDRMKAEKAEADSKAEQERLKAKGDYEAAQKLKDEEHAAEIAKLKGEAQLARLEAEFANNGIKDLRAVGGIFAKDYNPETETASAFAARMKAAPENALYFSDQKRVPKDPPSSGGGQPDGFNPETDAKSWLKSKDPQKVARATAWWDAHYAKQGAQ